MLVLDAVLDYEELRIYCKWPSRCLCCLTELNKKLWGCFFGDQLLCHQ